MATIVMIQSAMREIQVHPINCPSLSTILICVQRCSRADLRRDCVANRGSGPEAARDAQRVRIDSQGDRNCDQDRPQVGCAALPAGRPAHRPVKTTLRY
jgi:hypothetical protein